MNTSIKTQHIQPVLYALNQADNEGHLIFQENQLKATVIDPATVLMEDATIRSDKFQNYEPGTHEELEMDTEHGEGVYIGINYSLLHSILKKQDEDAVVTFTVGDNESELHITVEGNTYQLPLLNLNVDEIDTGDLEFNAEAEIKREDFKYALDNAGLFSSAAKMIVQGEELVLTADGGEGQTEQTVTLQQVEDLRDEEDGDKVAESLYALDYLNSIRKSCKEIGADTVKFSIGNDFPLKVIAGGDGRKVEMILAPRIEEA